MAHRFQPAGTELAEQLERFYQLVAIVEHFNDLCHFDYLLAIYISAENGANFRGFVLL